MQTAVLASLGLIRHLEEEISRIETMILKKLKIKKELARLITLPGIGTILTLTIMLEVENIRRFPTVGDYSSYCRCVNPKNTITIGHLQHKARQGFPHFPLRMTTAGAVFGPTPDYHCSDRSNCSAVGINLGGVKTDAGK